MEIDREVASLRSEADHIEIALQVIEKYAPSSGGDEDEPKSGAPRPDGLPTLFDMVVYSLRDAGGEGLNSQGLSGKIRTRYWPGLVSQQIMPSVYRFVKEGRIVKRGDKFHLPDEGGQAASKELGPATGVTDPKGA
ncbi:MAG: hypothetical protein M9932_14480 [Xanthobacteraceae bacterium]|nr:hypothetical protein [Xanthobacteraceae bacterium]